MCELCTEQPIEASIVQLENHGYTVIEAGADKQYGVSWDGRIVAVTSQKDRAIAQVAQSSSGVGKWVVKERVCGPWQDIEVPGGDASR